MHESPDNRKDHSQTSKSSQNNLQQRPTTDMKVWKIKLKVKNTANKM